MGKYDHLNFTLDIDKVLNFEKMFGRVEKYLGLRVHLIEDTPNTAKRGDIFLFNHFTRFETIIIPVYLYRLAGHFCNYIAAKDLFRVNPKMAAFMAERGAFPTDYPGLLPHLAAQILRGHKVIIFPEGGLIKNKSVVDAKGNFGYYSISANAIRKQHTGAAVLALMIDLFKSRILWLHKSNDTARLGRWCTSLGFASVDDLVKKAKEPTYIVPSNITFYPLRISDNILSKGVKRFAKNAPEGILEELTIEGNLLLRDTDMTIAFGELIPAHKRLNKVQMMMLNRYFLSVNSLDDLFALGSNASTVSEKMLSAMIQSESEKLRDTYMERIYKNVQVNFSHLTATLLMELARRGEFEISVSKLHKMLYVLVKKYQAISDGHAHASVAIPDEYWGVLYGRCRALKQFMETAQVAGLVRVVPGDKYVISKKLLADYDYSMLRKQNPIAIYENEAGPKPEVKKAVIDTIETIDDITPQDIAHFMFDDEILATARQRDIHAGQELGEDYIQEADAYPYFLEPEKAPKKVKNSGLGVLLVHGLLSSPKELREFGEELRQQGHTVLGMRLPGHATSHWDLNDKRYGHWFAAVLRNYEILMANCDKVAIVGFSTGAAVAAKFVSEYPVNCVGFVCAGAPLGLRDPNTKYVPLVSRINRIINRFTKYPGIKVMYNGGGDSVEHNYRTVPVNAIAELLRAAGHIRRSAHRINVPTLVIQSKDDSVIQPDSAQRIYDKLTVKDKELHFMDGDKHGIILYNIGETRRLISKFLARVAKDEK